MNPALRSAVFVTLLMRPCIAPAQTSDRSTTDAFPLTEDLFGTPDEEENIEVLAEEIIQMRTRPIDLNNAGESALTSSGVISLEAARAIISYRALNGPLLSVLELQAIAGFDRTQIEEMLPFVTVNDPGSAIDRTLITRIRRESSNYFMLRYSLKRNSEADSSAATGSPEQTLIRFRSQRPGDFSFGFSGEKDAGESYRWNPSSASYGMDRWSFHVQLLNKGNLRNLIVGDFQAQFGQGIMMGGGFGAGKGSETVTLVRRANVGLFPYTSAYEAGNMRGVGATLRLTKHMDLSLFLSNTRRDAALQGKGENATVTGLQQSGLHRTPAETESRRSLKELQGGVVLQYVYRRLEAGLMFTQSRFAYALDPVARPYNQFALRGKTLTNAGFFLNYNLGRFSTFTEVAHDPGNGTALVIGVLTALTQKLDLSLLVRRYAADFHARFSNAISENSAPVNEHGLYMGWKYSFSRRLSASGYVDLFEFPWLRYRGYAPSAGYEWLFRLTFQPFRNTLFYAQAREEFKLRNESNDDSPLYAQVPGRKNNYWIHIETGLREHLRLRTKFQFTTYTDGSVLTSGALLSQDIRVDWRRLELTARYAVFRTDSYDNRLYSYENDVLFAYAMPAYNGIGTRTMAMIRYTANRHLSGWIRYAETLTHGTEDHSPPTGRASVREFRVQVRVGF